MELRYKDKVLTSTGGKEYTSGDGITIENDVINVTTPVKSILTQDEFDTLTEEEQNSGLYIISGEGGQSTDFVSKDEFDEALAEKQDKLTGTQGQVVGFDADGNAIAQNLEPSVKSDSITTIKFVTKTEYDALTTKDSTTLYLIKEEE